MKKLTKEQFISVSVMLFGLFFGAGNLIFPPILGNQAGSKTLESLLFFSVTAVVFPILGVVVVAKTKGLSNLSGRVGKYFAFVYTAMIYLEIGPGLGIPRAGSLPFEMAVAPYLPNGISITVSRLIYTFLFFLVAYLICLRPIKLVNRMGKFLTPSLLILILVMFLGVLFNNPNNVAQPLEIYKNAKVKGFLEGYNTMDTIAALNFGLVISLAVKSFKVEDEKQVMNYTIKAGVVAGLFLFVVYAMLSYIGMTTSGLNQGAKNGAEILSSISLHIFGNFGIILLAGIFTLACLTTCVGLITSVSQYFAKLTNDKVSYNVWIIIWSLISFFVANFGLNVILKISVPVLVAIYPVSIVLIALGLTQKYLKYNKFDYRLICGVTVFISLVEALKIANINLPLITDLVIKLPFFDISLCWVVPMLVCFVLSFLQKFTFGKTKEF